MVLLSFQGFIRDIRYTPVLLSNIQTYDIDNFDINLANTFGVINLDSAANNLAFSKWVSPKRTRSYPFARIYNTYHLNTKRITIIPIIKDEGLAGDNDRINFITFSWMNLLNVYIILAWYEDADPVQEGINKITGMLIGSLSLPTDNLIIQNFCIANRFQQSQSKIILSLNQEATVNPKLSILISSRN